LLARQGPEYQGKVLLVELTSLAPFMVLALAVVQLL
jgi:hypothetical protein